MTKAVLLLDPSDAELSSPRPLPSVRNDRSPETHLI
jgi:hypothetical protein